MYFFLTFSKRNNLIKNGFLSGKAENKVPHGHSGPDSGFKYSRDCQLSFTPYFWQILSSFLLPAAKSSAKHGLQKLWGQVFAHEELSVLEESKM